MAKRQCKSASQMAPYSLLPVLVKCSALEKKVLFGTHPHFFSWLPDELVILMMLNRFTSYVALWLIKGAERDNWLHSINKLDSIPGQQRQTNQR